MITAPTFAEAIAAKAEIEVSVVEATLLRHSVVDAPAPPPARPLRVRRIHFTGVKTVQGGEIPIDFTWKTPEDGVWAIATEDNFAGKSTIIQVALWALRGSPKAVTQAVRGWIRHVEADFEAGSRKLFVSFDCSAEEVVGYIDVKDGENSRRLLFGSEDAFKQLMSDVILEALALEPLASSRENKAEGRVVPYLDRWTAYTGALLFDSDSTTLIGEQFGNDLHQRLLQVFLGLPWATTLFQARARRRALEADAAQRRRQLAALGGKSIEDLHSELENIKTQLSEGMVQDRALAELQAVRDEFERLTQVVRKLRDDLTAAEDELDEADGLRRRAKRDLLEVQEEHASAAFLGRLDPTCCPRCSTLIGEERRQTERLHGTCSVCTTPVEPMDPAVAEAAIAEATASLEHLEKAELRARRHRDAIEAKAKAARAEQLKAAQRYTVLAAKGTAADARVLELEKARLEGVIETIERMLDSDAVNSLDVKILAAAADEATDRVEASATAVLNRANELVADLVRKLGMEDVESVSIKRNANVRLLKGGSESTFSSLAPGERLRLRIATVLALVKSANEHGVGRHPGLLFIDSPTAEEMADANIETMLEALAGLPSHVPEVQMFVASRGVAHAEAAFPADRLLTARAGAKLW